MLSNVEVKSFVPELSALLAVSVLLISPVKALEDPFSVKKLSDGIVVADSHGHSKKEKFAKMDTDNNAMVSKEEFLAYAEKKFTKKDKNNDGVLSKEEMKVMVPR